MASDSLNSLSDLLDQERNALLSADLQALAGLGRRKERLIQRLARDFDAAQLAGLEEKLNRNGELLAAAADGLKVGIARLRVIAAPPSLATYDGKGMRRDLPAPTTEVVRRA